MNLIKKKSGLLFILFFTVLNFTCNSQVNQVLTTKIAVDQIKKGLTDVVDQAMDRVDYSVAKAAIEAISVIDAWEKSNSKLLDKMKVSVDSEHN